MDGMASPPTRPSAAKVLPDQLDRDEFAQRLGHCHGRLWGLAAGILGDRNEAEDVVQEAALVALRRLDQFKPGTNFLAWMARIVRFQAFNWARKRIGRRTESVDPGDMDRQIAERPTADQKKWADPEQVVELGDDQAEFDDAVMDALRSLAPEARACLLLRIVNELSYREIALMMDLPEGTAMSHVHRAKKVMRSSLTRRDDAEFSRPPARDKATR